MTRIVLPGMVERKKGVLINIGSASSIIPSPMLTVYAATKVKHLGKDDTQKIEYLTGFILLYFSNSREQIRHI